MLTLIRVPAVFAAFLLFGISTSALGEFVVPTFRGQALATYQEWNIFTSATGANFPDVADNNPNGSASLVETTGAAFITSGGNFYSFAGLTEFMASVPEFDLGPEAMTSAVVQIRTLGTLLDTASVTFNGVPADSVEILYEEPLGGFGGVLRDWKFTWSEVGGNAQTNIVHFRSVESSMSLDRLAIDTMASESSTNLGLTGARVLNVGFSGSSPDPWKEVDLTTEVIQRSANDQVFQISNLINGSRGLNGLVFDFNNLDNLDNIDFAFSWSPQGAFNPQSNSVETWQSAPSPSSVSLHSGEGEGHSDRVRIEWPNNTISNRYLRIVITSGDDQVADLFVGHLIGKTIEATGSVYSVAFSDIPLIRDFSGQSVDAGSKADIDKTGSVTFADIAAMRPGIGTQLSRLTVPAQ